MLVMPSNFWMSTTNVNKKQGMYIGDFKTFMNMTLWPVVLIIVETLTKLERVEVIIR